jgi:hypothetical protein
LQLLRPQRCPRVGRKQQYRMRSPHGLTMLAKLRQQS